ncbi:MAG: rhodanese-like domain-containing protein [Candidatus Thermoplasmatota archaeon]|nr:rhodanese-like domain-containing protein [Candidatus Thermoplasmatota archaeon]MCL5731085.1 rhodanese-like domain-containing protein [Candidatus Thermoplasmatota archaeon]
MPFLSYFINPKGLKEYTPEEFLGEISSEHSVVIDVRTSIEFNHGHLKSAIHIPLSSFREQMSGLNRDARYYLVCATGHRSRAAATMMIKNGFKEVSHLKGGMMAMNRYEKRKER